MDHAECSQKRSQNQCQFRSRFQVAKGCPEEAWRALGVPPYMAGSRPDPGIPSGAGARPTPLFFTFMMVKRKIRIIPLEPFVDKIPDDAWKLPDDAQKLPTDARKLPDY